MGGILSLLKGFWTGTAWPFLQKFYREVAIGILILLLIGSVKSCKRNAEDLKVANQLYHNADSVGITYQLKNGMDAQQIHTQQLTIHQIRGENISLFMDKQALTEQVGNLNRLVAHYQGSISMDNFLNSGGRDTVYLEIVGKDTTRRPAKQFSFKNKWLALEETYTPYNDSIRRHYQYQVDFTLTTYWKGKNFFKRGDLVSDLVFDDPNIKVRKFTGINVVVPPPPVYKQNWFWGLVGLATGFAIAK